MVVVTSIDSLGVFSADNSDLFESPTKRHLQNHPFSTYIWPELRKQNATTKHRMVLKRAMNQEKMGFFGYHGGKRDVRIYQDVIRFAFEEVLHIPIREDFHFLRTPGYPDFNINSAKEFLDAHKTEIIDTLPLESSQLLAMNFALYENYLRPAECSPYYFVKNSNWKQYDYEKKLIWFFEAIGLDPAAIHGAFEIARSSLPNGGVLLQMFDTSEKSYALANSQAYVSHGRGRRYYPEKKLSDFILDNSKRAFPEIRMVLNSETTLNPFSSLSIQRYDISTREETAAYKEKMRAYFRSLNVTEAKRDEYIDKISSIWKQNLKSLQVAA